MGFNLLNAERRGMRKILVIESFLGTSTDARQAQTAVLDRHSSPVGPSRERVVRYISLRTALPSLDCGIDMYMADARHLFGSTGGLLKVRCSFDAPKLGERLGELESSIMAVSML